MFENISTGNSKVLDVSTGTFSGKENQLSDPVDKMCSSLYIKDKFSISEVP